jgi:hypothetical protein
VIALGSDCLVFRMPSGEGIPLSPGMVSVELIGSTAAMMDSDFVSHASDAVFYYFKHELGQDSVSVGEFTLALEKVLRGFKLKEEDARQISSGSDLNRLARESGKGCELFFFPRLRDELKAQLRHSPKVLRFKGLRGCVKHLAGAQRWSPRCQTLHDQIVEFLRQCVATDLRAVDCTLLVK